MLTSVTEPDLRVRVIKACLNSVGTFAVLSDKFIRKLNDDEILAALYLESLPVAVFLFKCLSSFSIKILGTYWKMNLGDTVLLIFGGLHQTKSLS